MFNKIVCFYFIAIFGCISTEVVDHKPCPGVGDSCQITEVRIDPCKEYPKPCRFKKGINASISFDFIPDFSTTTLKTMVYWANGMSEPEFIDFDGDACKVTTCPTQRAVSQQFNYNLHIGRKLPSGTYPIKWKIWNEQDNSEVCCFLTTIALRK